MKNLKAPIARCFTKLHMTALQIKCYRPRACHDRVSVPLSICLYSLSPIISRRTSSLIFFSSKSGWRCLTPASTIRRRLSLISNAILARTSGPSLRRISNSFLAASRVVSAGIPFIIIATTQFPFPKARSFASLRMTPLGFILPTGSFLRQPIGAFSGRNRGRG